MPPNGPPPPLPDYPDDTPRPTSPPPPRRQKYHPVVQAALINGFCLALRRVIRDFRSVELSDTEIERMFWDAIEDRQGESTTKTIDADRQENQ